MIKIMSPQTYVQDNLREAVLQLRLPLPRCIKSTTKITCCECRQWLLQLRAPNSSIFLPQNNPKHESHMVGFSTATSLGLMVLETVHMLQGDRTADGYSKKLRGHIFNGKQDTERAN